MTSSALQKSRFLSIWAAEIWADSGAGATQIRNGPATRHWPTFAAAAAAAAAAAVPWPGGRG